MFAAPFAFRALSGLYQRIPPDVERETAFIRRRNALTRDINIRHERDFDEKNKCYVHKMLHCTFLGTVIAIMDYFLIHIGRFGLINLPVKIFKFFFLPDRTCIVLSLLFNDPDQ